MLTSTLSGTSIFCTHEHLVTPIDGALASALSEAREVCVEVTFDTAEANRGEFFYVDLVNGSGTKRMHCSLRVREGYLVLNTNTDGQWNSAEQSIEFDLALMRFWRFWIVIEPSGVTRLQLGHRTLCRFEMGIPAQDIASCESNVSTKCVLLPQGETADICGLWSQTEEDGGVALIYVAAEHELEQQDLGLYASDVAIELSDFRSVRLGPDCWYAVRFSNPTTLSLDLRAAKQTEIIYDVLAMPVAEVSAGSINLRSVIACEAQDVVWTSQNTGISTSVRLVTRIDENRDVRGIGYQRSFTQLSDFLRSVSIEYPVAEFSLTAPGVTDGYYRMNISAETYRVLELYTRRLAEAQTEMSAIQKMILLDWWSVLRAEEHKDIVQKTAPHLYRFLADLAKEFVSLELLGEENAAISSIDIDGDPTAECLALWRALREINPLLADNNIDAQILQAKVNSAGAILPVDVREWFLWELAVPLIKAGLKETLNTGISDVFLKARLEDQSNSWMISTSLAILAVKGQFEDCIGIVYALGEEGRRDINISAVALMAQLALHRDGTTITVRRNLLYAFFHLIYQQNSESYSAFRNIDVFDALAQIILESWAHPDFFKREVITLIEQQYSTVPEFWERLATHSTGPHPLGAQFDIVSQRALDGNKWLRQLQMKSTFTDQKLPENIALVASGERLHYLQTFLGVNKLIAQRPETSLSEMHENIFLRLAAHPFRTVGDDHETCFRSTVLEMQHYPIIPHLSLMEIIGRALFLGDSKKVCETLLPKISNLKEMEDPATEAVLLDALIWALGEQGPMDATLVNSLILQLIDRYNTQINAQITIPSALFSATARLLGQTNLDITTQRQLEFLKNYCPPEYQGNNTLSRKGQPFFADTLVALVTCRPYLDTRAKECRDTWLKDMEAAGAKVMFFCGSDKLSDEAIIDEHSGIVQLPVLDSYEELPSKIVEMFRWIYVNRPENYVLKIDDDCYLDAQNFLMPLSYRRNHYFGRKVYSKADTFNRLWHQSKSRNEWAQRAIDTSLTGTEYADGGGSYVVSRFALAALKNAAGSSEGLRLRMASFLEDKLVGDLMRLAGVRFSDQGYNNVQARRTHGGATPVLSRDRTFYPSAKSGIAIAHLDQEGLMKNLRETRGSANLSPSRLWPMQEKPLLTDAANMLELLTHDNAQEKLCAAELICVMAIRNEMTILPHFLDHYRGQGVDLFLVADNLSDDGSREYLAEQPDVLLFSAANDYNMSHYGVAWQRMLLDHFCVGRWVVLANADEFIVTPENEPNALKYYCNNLEKSGYDAAQVMMVDMYPRGSLQAADFTRLAPTEVATAFDATPVHPWALNRGPFGNIMSYTSSLRHRLMPLSSPHQFTAQKVALFRFNPLMSFSEGFHFGTGLQLSPKILAFMHFKYSVEFSKNAEKESQRGQHFADGIEYQAYLKLLDKGLDTLWEDGVSQLVNPTRGVLLSKLLSRVDLPNNVDGFLGNY